MSGLGTHIAAMIRSYAESDESSFYSIALQAASQEAKQGHKLVATDIKNAVDKARASIQDKEEYSSPLNNTRTCTIRTPEFIQTLSVETCTLTWDKDNNLRWTIEAVEPPGDTPSTL